LGRDQRDKFHADDSLVPPAVSTMHTDEYRDINKHADDGRTDGRTSWPVKTLKVRARIEVFKHAPGG